MSEPCDLSIMLCFLFRAMDVNGAENVVYWTDPTRKTVFRAYVPDSDSQMPIAQDLDIYSQEIVPEGIAIDWVTQ